MPGAPFVASSTALESLVNLDVVYEGTPGFRFVGLSVYLRLKYFSASRGPWFQQDPDTDRQTLKRFSGFAQLVFWFRPTCCLCSRAPHTLCEAGNSSVSLGPVVALRERGWSHEPGWYVVNGHLLSSTCKGLLVVKSELNLF